MLDHPYSFVAVREGASVAGDTLEVNLASTALAGASRRVVRLEAAGEPYVFDGKGRSEAELLESIAKTARADPAMTVMLRVSDAVPFERVRRAAGALRAAGVRSIELVLSADTGEPD